MPLADTLLLTLTPVQHALVVACLVVNSLLFVEIVICLVITRREIRAYGHEVNLDEILAVDGVDTEQVTHLGLK